LQAPDVCPKIMAAAKALYCAVRYCDPPSKGSRMVHRDPVKTVGRNVVSPVVAFAHTETPPGPEVGIASAFPKRERA
jgi:hypothetical protein